MLSEETLADLINDVLEDIQAGDIEEAKSGTEPGITVPLSQLREIFSALDELITWRDTHPDETMECVFETEYGIQVSQ